MKAVIALFLLAACVLLAFISSDKTAPDYQSCVVISPSVTLIPAKPNSITILRNGSREVCYIYSDYPRGKENALPNKSP
jgi:hypothetical protein